MHTCPLTAANTRLTERVVAKHMAHVAPAQLDPEQLAHHLEHALDHTEGDAHARR